MEKNRIMSFDKENMPKIILTGACGFIGSNIANRLFELEYKTQNIDDLSFGNKKNIQTQFIKSGFEHLSEQFLSKFDILIHCATSNIIYAMAHPIETFQNNATNTIKLFQKFRGKIIYTSTASVYGQADIIPTSEDAEIRTNNAYDQSKYIAELFLQQRGDYTTLRLSNVYGTNQRADNPYCGVMGKMINSILNHQIVKIYGDGTQTRDYTFVDDVVNAIMLAIGKEALNTEINIASGQEINIKYLYAKIADILQIKANAEYIDKRKIDNISRRCLNIEKAKHLLGWEPQIKTEEGILKTINQCQK